MVADQERALKFYTEMLGFVKKTDVPAGGGRWLTVVSPEEPDGTELLLEPMASRPLASTRRNFTMGAFRSRHSWPRMWQRNANG